MPIGFGSWQAARSTRKAWSIKVFTFHWRILTFQIFIIFLILVCRRELATTSKCSIIVFLNKTTLLRSTENRLREKISFIKSIISQWKKGNTLPGGLQGSLHVQMVHPSLFFWYPYGHVLAWGQASDGQGLVPVFLLVSVEWPPTKKKFGVWKSLQNLFTFDHRNINRWLFCSTNISCDTHIIDVM